MDVNYITENNITILKNENVYIYGAGEFAHDIKHVLENNDIKIQAFVVDDQYAVEIASMERENSRILSLSTYKGQEKEFDIVINGIASIANFRRIVKEHTFGFLWVLFEPVSLWKYDAHFFEANEIRLKKTESFFADDNSRASMRAFLEAKKAGGADSVITCASEEHTYFNSLTSGKFDGAYVDCGAYNGDSVNQYINFAGLNAKEIFAFEPDKENYGDMKLQFNDKTNIHCINKGIWNREERLNFSLQGDMASKLTNKEDEKNQVNVIDIDSVVTTTKVGFIKMDIEGCELEGLQGAGKTIYRDHPVLAISAYHKQEDLIVLPEYIKSFEDEQWRYDLYLRHHGVCAYELVLYAIPVRK